MSDAASQSLPLNNNEQEATPGQQEPVRWEVVARMPGLTPATIVAGRLQAEGIPARAWQEGAGQALGLTVGLLGTGYVAVPESYAEKALDLLSESAELDIEPDADDWKEDTD